MPIAEETRKSTNLNASQLNNSSFPLQNNMMHDQSVLITNRRSGDVNPLIRPTELNQSALQVSMHHDIIPNQSQRDQSQQEEAEEQKLEPASRQNLVSERNFGTVDSDVRSSKFFVRESQQQGSLEASLRMSGLHESKKVQQKSETTKEEPLGDVNQLNEKSENGIRESIQLKEQDLNNQKEMEQAEEEKLNDEINQLPNKVY